MAELMIIVLGIVVVAGAFSKGGPVQLLKKITKLCLRAGLKTLISVAKLGLSIVH
jgi:hypothetical protein